MVFDLGVIAPVTVTPTLGVIALVTVISVTVISCSKPIEPVSLASFAATHPELELTEYPSTQHICVSGKFVARQFTGERVQFYPPDDHHGSSVSFLSTETSFAVDLSNKLLVATSVMAPTEFFELKKRESWRTGFLVSQAASVPLEASGFIIDHVHDCISPSKKTIYSIALIYKVVGNRS